MPVDDCSLLAVAQFGVADTRALGRAAQRVALLDSDLVIRITLVLRCLLARVGLFHGRILLRVGSYAVDLGVALGLDQRRVRFLNAHVLGIARNIVTFFLGAAQPARLNPAVINSAIISLDILPPCVRK